MQLQNQENQVPILTELWIPDLVNPQLLKTTRLMLRTRFMVNSKNR